MRLHIIANSDSEDDQAMKLLARDAVLTRAEAILRQASNREEAMEARWPASSEDWPTVR